MTYHEPRLGARRNVVAKVAAFGLALGLSALGLVGCSSTTASTSTTGGAGTLTIQTPWDDASPYQKPFATVVADFEKSSGIQVEVTNTSSDQNQQIFTNKVLSGEEPDLILTNPTRDALSWVEQGATVSVSDYVTEWGLGDVIYADALTANNWLTDDGKLRGFPLQGFVWPTWYKTDTLTGTNGSAPATEADVSSYVAGLGGKDAVIVGGADWSGFNAFLMTLQSYLSIDELNNLCAKGGWSSDEKARKGVEWFVKLRDLGFWSANSTGQTVDGANAAFQGGKAEGLTLISDYFSDVPEDLSNNITLGGIPIPADATVKAPVVMSAYTGSGVMISKSGAADNLDAIKQFVTYLYTPESLSVMSTDGGMIVAADAGSDTATGLLAQANGEKFRSSVTFVEATNIPTDVVESVTRAASIAWTKGATVDKILTALDAVY